MSGHRVRRGRSAIALFLVGVAGLVLFRGVLERWAERGPTISPSSDLAIPPLFAREELTYEDLAADTSGGVPVLCYHYFRPGLTPLRLARVLGAVLLNLPTVPDKDYWTTTVPEFERQMRYLAENGFRTIGLDELADHLDGRRRVHPRSVVITIDDGDRSFVEYAVPVLRRFGFTATVFLLTGRTGEIGWNDLDLVDWETLRDLEREGVVRVESHTHRMHSKVRYGGAWVPRYLVECRNARGEVSSDSPLGEDLRLSREEIRTRLGHDSRFLAWPFGYGDKAVDSLARSSGVRRILTLRPERNRPDLLDGVGDRGGANGRDGAGPARPLGRFAVTARTSFRVFRLMILGPDPASTPVAGTARAGRNRV